MLTYLTLLCTYGVQMCSNGAFLRTDFLFFLFDFGLQCLNLVVACIQQHALLDQFHLSLLYLILLLLYLPFGILYLLLHLLEQALGVRTLVGHAVNLFPHVIYLSVFLFALGVVCYDFLIQLGGKGCYLAVLGFEDLAMFLLRLLHCCCLGAELGAHVLDFLFALSNLYL